MRIVYSRKRVAALAVVLALMATSVAPMPAVGAESTSPAVIVVKVGGDRQQDGTVSGAPGVELSLFNAGTGNSGDANSSRQGDAGPRYEYPWATCVSDAEGLCRFEIPLRGGEPSQTGVPADTRFWVQQTGTDPQGWYSNRVARLGGFGASPEYSWEYRFRTGKELRAGVTYWSDAVPTAEQARDADDGFMSNRSDSVQEGAPYQNISRSTGVWNQSRANPSLEKTYCGLDIALVVDTSGSLNQPGIWETRKAIAGFVDALEGTPSHLSLFSFSSDSPGAGASNAPDHYPVATAEQAAVFKALSAKWTANGGTNWDRGLAAAANSSNHYDLAIMLTDGNPTMFGTHPDPAASAYNSNQDIDAGVFSANQLKSQGTRVIAVGVGEGLTAASKANLRAITGPLEGSDFFRVATFAEQGAILRQIADQGCEGSVEVQKMLVPEGGSITDAAPAPAGWQFAATSETAGVSLGEETTVDTDAEGRVIFGMRFAGDTTTGPVQIVETQQPGYEILPQEGSNATCVNANSGLAVPTHNSGDAASPGFIVDTHVDDLIRCVVFNTQVAIEPPTRLSARKTASPSTGHPVAPGEPIHYTLTFANAGTEPVAVDHVDVLAGALDDATLTGAPTVSNPALTASAVGDDESFAITGTLAAGQTVTVSYSVLVDVAPSTRGDGSIVNLLLAGDEPRPETPVSCDAEELDTVGCTQHRRDGAGSTPPSPPTPPTSPMGSMPSETTAGVLADTGGLAPTGLVLLALLTLLGGSALRRRRRS